MKSEPKSTKPVEIKKVAAPEAHGVETVRVVRLVLAAFLLFMLLRAIFLLPAAGRLLRQAG